MSLAGMPPTKVFSSTSPLTKHKAPVSAFSPIVVPLLIIVYQDIMAFFLIIVLPKEKDWLRNS